MKSSFLKLKFVKQALVACLVISVIAVSCGKKDSTPPPPPADKTALKAAVDTAQMLNDNTAEGTKPGEYEAGSKAALTTALTASTVVLNNATATQSDVANTVAQLNAAIAGYRGHYIDEIAATNLIGYWKMNGNANDSSGNGNDGTVTMGAAFFGAGTPNLTADRFGRANMAYHFDKGGNIEVPYKSSLNPQQMSISLWAFQDTAGRRVNPANCYMVSMDRWNGYKFQTQPSLPFFTVHAIEPAGDTTYYDRDDAGTAILPATWYHLVVTYKAGAEDFYINGDLVKEWTNVTGTPITVNNINMTIGSDLPTNKYLTVDPTGNFLVDYGGFWTGDLDDVMFYNIALTGPQVKSIYNNQKTQ
ncbi:MAG: LamG-like jellyroll fold domain-containing protein [Ginsengibacter sp.]